MLLIKTLAKQSGVSARTLRHYDDIGLLKPAAYSASGYRMYDEQQVLLLQQILLYKQMGLSLENIKQLLHDSSFTIEQALQQHLVRLQEQQHMLEVKVQTVQRTLRYVKGEITMKTNEQFEGLKQQQIVQNEALYGDEVRATYGEESVMAAYGQFQQMTPAQYEGAKNLEAQIFTLLRDVLNDEDDDTLLEIAELHKRWLSMYWPKYTKIAHRGLSELYVADERFTSYYDAHVGDGATKLLYKAIQLYTK